MYYITLHTVLSPTHYYNPANSKSISSIPTVAIEQGTIGHTTTVAIVKILVFNLLVSEAK